MPLRVGPGSKYELEESTVEKPDSVQNLEFDANNPSGQSTIQVLEWLRTRTTEAITTYKRSEKVTDSIEQYNSEDGAVNFIFVISMIIALAV
jgi:hypothetical protein